MMILRDSLLVYFWFFSKIQYFDVHFRQAQMIRNFLKEKDENVLIILTMTNICNGPNETKTMICSDIII